MIGRMDSEFQTLGGGMVNNEQKARGPEAVRIIIALLILAGRAGTLRRQFELGVGLAMVDKMIS